MSLLLIALVCFVSGLLSGAMGFGALIIMVPALIFLVGKSIAIPLGVLCGVATQSMNAYSHRKHLKKKAVVPVLLGSLPGLWLGSAVLSTLPEIWFRAALGIFIIGYVLWALFARLAPPTRLPASVWAYAAGFLSGAFGGAFGVNGPPAVMYATRTGWSSDAIRAFLGTFCGLLSVITALTQYLCGLIGPQVWTFSLVALPACLLGNSCGQWLTAHLPAEQYLIFVFGILLIMGLSLCQPAFVALLFSGQV